WSSDVCSSALQRQPVAAQMCVDVLCATNDLLVHFCAAIPCATEVAQYNQQHNGSQCLADFFAHDFCNVQHSTMLLHAPRSSIVRLPDCRGNVAECKMWLVG